MINLLNHSLKSLLSLFCLRKIDIYDYYYKFLVINNLLEKNRYL